MDVFFALLLSIIASLELYSGAAKRDIPFDHDSLNKNLHLARGIQFSIGIIMAIVAIRYLTLALH